MEGGRNPNFWPGFVDALSNLVLTLVFVMVIFVLALFYLSTKVAESKLEALCPSTKAELADTQKELEQTQQALREALAKMGQVDENVVVREKKMTPVLKREKISTETAAGGAAITIRFPMGVVELDEEAKAALDKTIEPLIASGQQIKSNLNAVPGPETYSEGKRVAFFRAVAVRNYLISKGVAKNDIDSKVLGQDQRDSDDPDGRVVIELQRISP